MHPNLQRLIESGALKMASPKEIPEEIRAKIEALTTEDVDAIVHLATKADPAAIKAMREYCQL